MEVGVAWHRWITIARVLYGATTSEPRTRLDFPSFLASRPMVALDDLDTYVAQRGRRLLGQQGAGDGDDDATDAAVRFPSAPEPSPGYVGAPVHDALRAAGFHVTEKWSIHDKASMEVAEQALRRSDLIVSLVGKGETGSANLFFELGVAVAGNKDFVAVVPKDLDPTRLPVPLEQDRDLP